ncbi:hypothetical protein ACFSKW_07660 [Nonomuraea mangrovi]|uniref:Uncharacterized protein n=1 Tax=Nonomuraea mangrovi TaxID=2316207 RepID=A0ABW4SRS2_9ACTN
MGSTKKTDETPTQQRSAMWSPYDEGPRSRTPLWFALGGLLVLGALVAGLVVMWNSEGPDPTADPVGRASAPPADQPVAPADKYGFAAARETDPDALTQKELFPKKKFTVSGRSYEVTTLKTDKKCGDAAEGDKLDKALKSAKCTQLIRATFKDKSGKVIGTVGVANLVDGKGAAKVAASVRAKGESKLFVKPLAGKDDITKFIGAGEASVHVATHGHYAVMLYVQFKDGHKPDKKDAKQLSQASVDVTKATVYPALDSRSLSGRRGG